MNVTTDRIRRSISLAALALLLPAAIFASDVVHAAPAAARVLVVGATGGTGREVVQQARAKGYKVRALVRDADKARASLGGDIELVVGDVRTEGTFERAVKDVDYVVSALGSNSRNDPTNETRGDRLRRGEIARDCSRRS
jgi:NADPH:quinone reductase-like Zn-dependent oxidoreductase